MRDPLNALAFSADHARVNNLARNLRALMTAAGVSENELARVSGVPQPTIHRILKGQSVDPRDGTLRPLAQLFGLTVEQLRVGDELLISDVALKAAQRSVDTGTFYVREKIPAYEVRAVDGDQEVDAEREVLIEEVDVQVSGGPGAWMPEFVETKYRMPFQLYWFRQKRAKPENVRVMRVRGSSMERTLFNGDKVVVNLGDRKVEDDHVYVLWYGGGVKVKRLFQLADGRLRVVSDNVDKEAYPDEYVSPGDLENVYVVGRVIDKSGSGGL